MGVSKNRRDALKRDHPICYFCATAPTEVPDHVPSRQCFKGRVGPEGFEFPACDRCNQMSAQLEQVFALYLTLADHSDDAVDDTTLHKLFRGVANNNPDLLPVMKMTAREARRHYKGKGLTLPAGMTFSEAPIAELPPGNQAVFHAFSRRLTCALYYKEVGHPLPLDFKIATGWVQTIDPSARALEKAVVDFLPEVTLTNRRNTNIGEQFLYRWGYRAEGIFAFAGQLRASFYIIGAAVSPALSVDADQKWRVHREDI